MFFKALIDGKRPRNFKVQTDLQVIQMNQKCKIHRDSPFYDSTQSSSFSKLGAYITHNATQPLSDITKGN